MALDSIAFEVWHNAIISNFDFVEEMIFNACLEG
jgi:hypothetical protein